MSKSSPSGSGKKLVQARLPFKTLSSSTEKTDKKLELNAIGADKNPQSNQIKVGKRKSLDEIVKPAAKIPRKELKPTEKSVVLSDEKENSKSSKKCSEIVISDDESIFDGESNASSVNENRDENVETKSSEASSISNADAVEAPSSKKSLKFGKKKAKQAESKAKSVLSKEGKNKEQAGDSPTEEGVVVLDESDKEEEEEKIDDETKTEIEEASDVCKQNEEIEKVEAKPADPVEVPDSDDDRTVEKDEPAKPTEIKKPEPVKETKKRATAIKKKEPEKVVDEFDATLGLMVSDSETEMGDESKAEMKKQKSKSPQAPPEPALKELRVVLTPISTKRGRPPTKTASPSASKRETPSRKAKLPKLEPSTSAVLEVSDNAMDISLSEKDTTFELDKSVDVSITESPAASSKEPRTPKLRSTNKPTPGVMSSEKKTPMSKLQKQKEREEKELQRLKEKEEREEKKRKEKEEKEEQRREKEEQKRKEREEKEEQRRKEKEEKEEQRKREKEEKEKKRLAELEAKNEEKRQKEEERKKREEQKEEERRKKEEERRKKEQEKEEAENKKKKAAEAFTKFFSLGKKSTATDAAPEVKQSEKLVFMPFRIKNGMKLAPVQRRELKANEKETLENTLKKTLPSKVLYLQELKENIITPRSTSATLTENYEKTSDSDIEIVDDDLKEVGETIEESKPIQKFRTKFLWFHENRRPPYYGTFRKKSDIVKPCRPFATDQKFFDYEVDSDDEWEEEEIGESLHGSDDEKEKESEDEYEVDNEFFVPHGHLSDEELQREDELDEIDDDDAAAREAQKEKMKLLEEEFNQSIKKRTEKIQPRLVGIVWQDENGNRPDSCSEKVWTTLMARAMLTHGVIVLEPPENLNPVIEQNVPNAMKKIAKKTEFDAEDVKNLAILVHGNRHKRQFLIREFQAFVNKDQTDPALSKFANVTIKNQFDKIAKWSVYSNDETKKKKLSWIVSDDILKQHGLENIGLKNKWKYVTEPKYENESEEVQIKDDEPKSRPSTPSVITKFTKVLSKEEKSQKFSKSSPASEQKNAFAIPKGDNSSSASKKEKGFGSKNLKKPTSASAKKTSCDIESTKIKKRKLFEKKEQKPESVETIELEDTNSEDESIKTESKESPEVKKDEPQVKKRAVLLSVPLGAEIPENVKNEFVSKNLKTKTDSEPIIVSEGVQTKDKPTEQPPKKKRAPLLSVPFGKVITEDAKKEFVSKVLTQNKSKSETTKKSEDKETLVVSKNPEKDEVSNTSKVESGKVSKRPPSPTRDQPPAKKRVPLLSVPLGKTIPDDVRNEFISKSLVKKKKENDTSPKPSDEAKTKVKTQTADTKSNEAMDVCEEKCLKLEKASTSTETFKMEEKQDKEIKSEDRSSQLAVKSTSKEEKKLKSEEEISEKSKTGSSEKGTGNTTDSAQQVTTIKSNLDNEKLKEPTSASKTKKTTEESSSEPKLEGSLTTSDGPKTDPEVKPSSTESTQSSDAEAKTALSPEEISEKSKTGSTKRETSNTPESEQESTSSAEKVKGSPSAMKADSEETSKTVEVLVKETSEKPKTEKETTINLCPDGVEEKSQVVNSDNKIETKSCDEKTPSDRVQDGEKEVNKETDTEVPSTTMKEDMER